MELCQRGEDFLCRVPQPVIALPQLLQVRVIEPARLMDAAGKLRADLSRVFFPNSILFVKVSVGMIWTIISHKFS